MNLEQIFEMCMWNFRHELMIRVRRVIDGHKEDEQEIWNRIAENCWEPYFTKLKEQRIEYA